MKRIVVLLWVLLLVVTCGWAQTRQPQLADSIVKVRNTDSIKQITDFFADTYGHVVLGAYDPGDSPQIVPYIWANLSFSAFNVKSFDNENKLKVNAIFYGYKSFGGLNFYRDYDEKAGIAGGLNLAFYKKDTSDIGCDYDLRLDLDAMYGIYGVYNRGETQTINNWRLGFGCSFKNYTGMKENKTKGKILFLADIGNGDNYSPEPLKNNCLSANGEFTFWSKSLGGYFGPTLGWDTWELFSQSDQKNRSFFYGGLLISLSNKHKDEVIRLTMNYRRNFKSNITGVYFELRLDGGIFY